MKAFWTSVGAAVVIAVIAAVILVGLVDMDAASVYSTASVRH